MKTLSVLLAALLLSVIGVSAQSRITLTITVTNKPAAGNTVTINGTTRTWGTAETISTILTNLVSVNANKTNMFRQFARWGFAGPLNLQDNGTNSLKLVGTLNGSLSASASGAWATLSLSTQGGGGFTYTALYPLENMVSSTDRVNEASSLVYGLGAYSTNAFPTNATALSNFVYRPPNPVEGQVLTASAGGVATWQTSGSGVSTNLTFVTSLGTLVLGVWDGRFGISNVTLGQLSFWLEEPDTGNEWALAGILNATNVTLTAIPGTGTNVGITAGGSLFRMTSAGSGSIFSNKSMFYVSTTGDNSTALPGRLDLPYRDPMAAQIAAAAAGGGTVAVFPGIFTTNNLGTNLVNFYGMPGAIINYVDNGSGPGKGIFDDRGKGGMTCTIWGAFDLRYSTGLTGYLVGTIDITPNPTNIANLRGAVCITNPLSVLNLSCSSITVTTLVNNAFVSAISVGNCARVNIHCPRILDPIATQSFFIGYDDAMNDTFASSAMTGVWWERGTCDVVADTIHGSGYAIYAIEPTFNAATQHLHVTANSIESFGTLHTVYVVGNSNAYKVWVNAQEIISRVGNTGTIGLYGEGRIYITAQKISSPTVAIYGALGNYEAWITSQRVNSKDRWVSQFGGRIDCAVSEWDDDGGITRGWNVTGGTLIVHDGEADVANGLGLVASATAKARFRNMHIDTSAGNLMTNTPVFVSTNGIILQNCVLVAPTAAPAIMSVGAQTVLAYTGIMQNKTNHPNITIQAGPYTVDANVR